MPREVARVEGVNQAKLRPVLKECLARVARRRARVGGELARQVVRGHDFDLAIPLWM